MALDQSARMLEQTAAQAPQATVRARGRAVAAVPGRGLRPRLHRALLRAPARGRAAALPRGGGAGRRRARRRRLRAGGGRRRRGGAGTRAQRRLDAGRSTSGGSPAPGSRPSSAAATCCTTAAGSSSCARRRDALPVARLAAARPGRAAGRASTAGHPLASLPVLAPFHDQRAYLFGQAPGIVEGEERRPWRGRAGRTLRRWLELDEDDVLRDLLLRVGHALLSGSRSLGPWRPHPDARGAGPVRGLARPGAARCSALG